MLGDDQTIKSVHTFKGVKIVNGQSVELVSKGDLLFLIQHRFGTLNSGGYNLYGLDNSQVRFGLDYGVNDWVSIGLGRSSFLKTIDANSKIKLVSQIKGRMLSLLVWFGILLFSLSSHMGRYAKRKLFMYGPNELCSSSFDCTQNE